MRKSTNPNRMPIPVPEPFKDFVHYVVAIAWAEGYGGTKVFNNRDDAIVYARSLLPMGYGRPDNPIRVWQEQHGLVAEILQPPKSDTQQTLPTPPEGVGL